jgi:hypothetical protein
VLDRCVDNFFAETEQVAFCTQNIVPGIDFTNDPLLQGRNFSYLDTQLKRLGGPNFTHLPINDPKCPFYTLQQDGHMAVVNPKGRANCEPNSWPGEMGGPRESSDRGFASHQAEEQGQKICIPSFGFQWNFTNVDLAFSVHETKGIWTPNPSMNRKERGIARSEFLLGGMDKVGKLDRVLDEKHWNVVSDNVPVALLCVGLHRQASYIAREAGRSFIACHSRKADKRRRFVSSPLEEIGLGNGHQRLIVLKESVDAKATRMNASLGNAFVSK